jgi:hypothetical protein
MKKTPFVAAALISLAAGALALLAAGVSPLRRRRRH